MSAIPCLWVNTHGFKQRQAQTEKGKIKRDIRSWGYSLVVKGPEFISNTVNMQIAKSRAVCPGLRLA